jgi:predicted RNA-binding Zn-ribbon protein involved in translation (DUF1610 family)
MQRVRLTIRHNDQDPADDLRYAARVKRDLWAHSPVEVDPGSEVHGTHRDANRNAYFEFATNYVEEVKRVLQDRKYEDRVDLKVVETVGDFECINCGNYSDPVTVCPNCGFRDISACPYCNQEIARLAYLPISGDLFRCPVCQHRARLGFHDPMFDSQGYYVQPLVIVERAEQ